MHCNTFLKGTQPQRKIAFGSKSQCMSRGRLHVEAAARSQRKQEVVLVEDIPGMGQKGTMTTVATGYYRNYLLPRGLAAPTTEAFLRNLQIEADNKEKAATALKAKASAMAMALQTIGKFHLKKKVGQNDKIFGSVTNQEVVDAIAQQTGRSLDKRLVTLPDIKEIGTYSASVKLHPEVIGEFKIVVQREKNKP